ncbi:MAG TPA: methyltransferase domain-containing protein, partial [Gaiellaceae bacterium]|nr:methyltransferase domain-containing protein [Gaiellaceae bacterium]
IARRVPLAPFRLLLPYRPWRALFRLWLAARAAHPDRARAARELLEAYADGYAALDRAAVRYGDGVHPKHRLTRYHDFFVERVRPGERVLDVGCGIGSVAHDLAERAGATVVAIDVSPWALAFARERHAHPRVSYVQADAVGFAPAEPVDVAVLSNVLEHVTARAQLLRSLRERAGARRLLVRVPSRERDWTVPLREELGLPWFSDPEHVVEYTPEELRAELAAAGWRMGEPVLRWGEIWVEAAPL